MMNRKLTATRESQLKVSRMNCDFSRKLSMRGEFHHLLFLKQGIRVIKMNVSIGKMQIKH